MPQASPDPAPPNLLSAMAQTQYIWSKNGLKAVIFMEKQEKQQEKKQKYNTPLAVL